MRGLDRKVIGVMREYCDAYVETFVNELDVDDIDVRTLFPELYAHMVQAVQEEDSDSWEDAKEEVLEAWRQLHPEHQISHPDDSDPIWLPAITAGLEAACQHLGIWVKVDFSWESQSRYLTAKTVFPLRIRISNHVEMRACDADFILDPTTNHKVSHVLNELVRRVRDPVYLLKGKTAREVTALLKSAGLTPAHACWPIILSLVKGRYWDELDWIQGLDLGQSSE
jgi:hypothetical protein